MRNTDDIFSRIVDGWRGDALFNRKFVNQPCAVLQDIRAIHCRNISITVHFSRAPLGRRIDDDDNLCGVLQNHHSIERRNFAIHIGVAVSISGDDMETRWRHPLSIASAVIGPRSPIVNGIEIEFGRNLPACHATARLNAVFRSDKICQTAIGIDFKTIGDVIPLWVSGIVDGQNRLSAHDISPLRWTVQRRA